MLEEFLSDAFDGTEGKIYVCSLTNDRSGREKHVLTRDVEKIKDFVAEQDVDGRGCFYCVSTIEGYRRFKTTARQTRMVHVDIDLKDLDATEDYVLGILDRLERPPSRVHMSGNGLHALWLLSEPAAAGDRVEAVLKKFQRALAGDAMVTQSVALMRMPGTHNSKRGERKEVRVLRRDPARYSLEELEDWQVPTVLLKKTQEPVEDNPFLRVAEEQGFRPPMDVEARLAGMRYRGEGESAIHTTQLSATASLLSSGLSEDEVVAKVLEATKVAAAGLSWDWGREERAIRQMCRDWERKLDRKVISSAKARSSASQANSSEQGNVVSMAEHVAAKKEPPAKKPGKDAHIVLAKGILEQMRQAGEAIVFTGGQMWSYSQSKWQPVPEERDWIDRRVEEGCGLLGLKSKNSLVTETRGWLRRQPELYMDKVPWDEHGKVAVRQGLLDLDTLELEPHRAEHWTTRWLDCDYDPEARCPWWEQMLADVLEDKVISLVQEVAGSFLVEARSRNLRRALVFFGASNTGKSNLIAALGGFFSTELNTTPLETLENAHGLMPFLQSRPWVLHEAFDQGRWHFSATTKALLSADPIGVNIKNGPLVPHVFKQPILWGTNTPPQFRESTKAMQNRLITIRCGREFTAEPVGAAKEAYDRGHASPAAFVLEEERSGMLNWAIAGWHRLRARGKFELPEGVAEAMHEMWLASNLAAGFIEECTEFDPTKMIAQPDFYGAFKLWWEENRGDQKVPSGQSLGMSLSSLGDARIAASPLLKDRLHRYYAGIKLNEKGLEFWQGYSSSRTASDSGARISGSAAEVCKDIPTEWNEREPIKKMRGA